MLANSFFSGLIQLGLISAALLTAANATPKSPKGVLKAYPIPPAIQRGTSFDIKVRLKGGIWENLETYYVEAHQINATTGVAVGMPSAMAYFDFNGTVEVQVHYKVVKAKKVVVRPASYNIAPHLSNSTITLKLSEPRSLVIQFDDETFDCLHLFANPLETWVPDSNSPDVIYYGPGIHNASKTANTVVVPSGKTVYLAGGAVLTAGLLFGNVSNVAVRGRGVVYCPAVTVQTKWSQNVTIEGITLVNSNILVGQSEGVAIRDIRSFSATQWGDGMDFYCSKDILVEGVFMRNSDDCFAIYSHRDTWYGDSTNITLRNSILWADVAHPINVGTHGNTLNPESITNVKFQNIDILDHREPQVDYQGAIALNPGDDNLIQNFLIEDIRVEDFRIGQLINMRVMYNTKYNTSPGRGIKDVLVRNLSYKGTHANMAIFVGYDETRTISNVTFQNLTVNGLTIYDAMRKPGWYKTTDFIPAF